MAATTASSAAAADSSKDGSAENAAQRHELFIREIESIDEYWGPTFRTIYDSEEHTKFLEKLNTRITGHDRDIERMCNHHYHGFIASIQDLLTVREQATRLKAEVTRVDSEVQQSAQQVIARSVELVKARRVTANICQAIETLSACLPVLRTYSKLQAQIQDKRYYPALKTLEQLEHTSLPRVARYRFTEQLRDSIPRLREDIKAASMTEIKDFLQEVRRMSPRIGQVAMKQVALQQYSLDLAPSAASNNIDSSLTISFENKPDPKSSPFSSIASANKAAFSTNPFGSADDSSPGGTPSKRKSTLGDNTNPFADETMNTASNPFSNGVDFTSSKVYESSSEAQTDEEAELSPEDLVDFCPVLRCLHIHTVLGERDQFHAYYRAQRMEQARLALQPPNNMHENAASFREYVQAVLGFFVVEEQLASTAPGLVDAQELQAAWQMAQGKAVNNIRNQASYITNTSLMLDIKKLIMLFARTLQAYGYPVSGIHELLLEIKDHYNEVLMTKWLQVFREIFDEDNYHPITVETSQEYHDITQVFPYQDPALEAQLFPKQFPFSLMVPKVYRQVKNYIAACLQFSEDLSLSESSKEDMVRRSTNLLLTRTLSGCLASLIKRPGLGLLQLIQITINTLHLEHANTMLESYVARLTGSSGGGSTSIANAGVVLGSMGGKAPLTLGNLQGKAMFKDIRGEAEEQIYAALRRKLDQFLDLANYDWMLVEATGHSSSFVADLIAFLNATFSSFTNLPVRVAGTACMSACQHIARSLVALLLADTVKQVSHTALEQLSLDVLQCEQFAAGEPVPGLEEGALVLCFAELRQLLDLFLSEDWSTFFSEYGRGDARFLRVSPANAAILVEKLLEGEKRGVFSRLKRSDKKKLLETVLKQLRLITNAQHA